MKAIVTIIILCILGTGAYVWFIRPQAEVNPAQEPAKATLSLVSPGVAGPHERNISIGGRLKLEKDLRALGDERKAAGQITNYGIFFRDLRDGPVLGINEETPFSPASLLKLPIAMWYYKKADSNPAILQEEIEFTGPKGISIEHFPASQTIEEGKTYTVEALIALMLAQSDNDATSVLSQYAGGRDTINSVYSDLGIKDVVDFGTYTIDVQTYSSLFRIIYNGKYISPEHSEQILEILSNTTFSAGLTAGVPKDTVVAHKFGERVVNSEKSVFQLHDCGIIYAPTGAYSLCVMTQGKEYDALASFIASVSKRVYSAVVAP